MRQDGPVFGEYLVGIWCTGERLVPLWLGFVGYLVVN